MFIPCKPKFYYIQVGFKGVWMHGEGVGDSHNSMHSNETVTKYNLQLKTHC